MKTMHTTEKFITLLYNRTSTETNTNNVCRKLFAKKCYIQLIPPTWTVLQQHVRRAVFHGRYGWGQALVPAPTLPSPTDWGWINIGGVYELLWTTLSEASKICRKLVSCKCKEDCLKKVQVKDSRSGLHTTACLRLGVL